MKELIDKAAVVAEIERRIAFFSDINNKQVVHGNLDCAIAFVGLRDFLDTLAVKEVDLEKELENLIEKEKAFVTDNWEVKYYNGDSFNHIYELEFIARYFFELGLKTQKGE